MKKQLINLLAILCLFATVFYTTSCSKENVEVTENYTSQTVLTASKVTSFQLNVSNDDDDLTTILIYDSSNQPATGLTAIIVDVNNSSVNYSAVSDSSGLATLGEVTPATYELTIIDGYTTLFMETLTVVGRNDFEVILAD